MENAWKIQYFRTIFSIIASQRAASLRLAANGSDTVRAQQLLAAIQSIALCLQGALSGELWAEKKRKGE